MNVDTLPLLRMLAETPHEMLSRGEIIRRGLDGALIDLAEQQEQVVVIAPTHARDGSKSSIASVLLTDVGAEVLDAAETA